MNQTVALSNVALLKELSQRRRQPLRKNVELLFIGLPLELADQVCTVLRGTHIGPRTRQVDTPEELLDELSQRSWDLIICGDQAAQLPARRIIELLYQQNRDIPVIQLLETCSKQAIYQGLHQQLKAVLPADDPELVLVCIRRELESLEQRRRLKRIDLLLHEAEQRQNRLMNHSSEALCCCDPDHIVYLNQSLLHQFGYDSSEALLNKPIDTLIMEDDQPVFQDQLRSFLQDHLTEQWQNLTCQRVDGSQFKASIGMQEIRHNGISTLLLTIRPEQALEERQQRLDLITGLPNGEQIHEQLDRCYRRALDGGHDCNLLYVQLENFNQLREQYGTYATDQLSLDAATLLREAIGNPHPLGRLQDDSYLVIYQDARQQTALEVARQLVSELDQLTLTAVKQPVELRWAAGVVPINDNAASIDALLSQGRKAIERTHQLNSGPHVELYTAIIHEPQSLQRDGVLQTLREAVEKERMKLLFQPVVGLAQQDSRGRYEVLLRLQDEQGREYSPAPFLTAFNLDTLCVQLDRWVINQCIQRLQQQGENTQLFINLNSRTLRDRNLINWIAELLRRHRVSGEQLIFQLSETDVLAQLQRARDWAESLKRLHSPLCIKHYGSSNSADRVLKQLKPRYVKLDGTYINDLNQDNLHDQNFMKLVSSLHAGDCQTIAPLVESARVMSKLWRAQIRYVQGHYLQSPSEEMQYDFFQQ
ncbi:EAL domain-containing protein [Marinobacterium arenosum]|uniref:EAL domain-containing protein n=1 Tax=Marinobacterium arenosum TaxID=2862496 RepID=UPI001C98DAF9|nr:EAL domain-containing protein [Marinobacterium arenosum]MBY4675686.1 EAL domain-containing protein [Marinobacterium arenosum]